VNSPLNGVAAAEVGAALARVAHGKAHNPRASTEAGNEESTFTLPECKMSSMRRAFILINTNPGTDAALQSELKKIEGIVGVYQVYGAYDMVVVVEAESEEQLKHIVFSQIRTLNYLRSTLTLNVVS
jgi:DNA-binding Lrp family transcriptional regulator